jgi:hypothetical protein
MEPSQPSDQAQIRALLRELEAGNKLNYALAQIVSAQDKQIIDLKLLLRAFSSGCDWPTEEKGTLGLRKRAKDALKDKA